MYRPGQLVIIDQRWNLREEMSTIDGTIRLYGTPIVIGAACACLVLAAIPERREKTVARRGWALMLLLAFGGFGWILSDTNYPCIIED